jgi:hypothetical protein
LGFRDVFEAMVAKYPRPDAPVYRVEEGGFCNYYLAHSPAEAREIHRTFSPLTPEETWSIERVPS